MYDVTKDAMQTRATPLLRFIDLWTLTLQIPEDCIGGHQSPMSTLWTWQLLLGSICQDTEPAKGSLAAFQGSMCRASDVEKQCADSEKLGYHYKWECGMSELCSLHAVVPPASMRPARISNEVVIVDFASASQVLEPMTWLESYRDKTGRLLWLLAAGIVALAGFLLWWLKCKRGATSVGKGGVYEPLAEEAGQQHVTESPQAAPQKPDVQSANTSNMEAEAQAATNGEAEPQKFAFGLARCLASLHVVAGHLYARQAIAAVYLFSWGFTWVPWFFMLSGFTLFSAEAARPRKDSVMGYVSRRAMTIYPLYALSLLLAFAIGKVLGTAPSLLTVVLEAWLGQAWLPFITENTLQMQCWFLSCLVVYWAAFKPLFNGVSKLKNIWQVAAVMTGLYMLPWLIICVPSLLGDLEWYEEHTFGHVNSLLDLAVVFLKFHPLCYFHVFLLGMLLAQFRLLLEPYAGVSHVKRMMQVLAPLGYILLLLVYCVPACCPWAPKLSARLSVLLPFQSALLLGLAGLPGRKLPYVAAKVARLNVLGDYSYAVYVFQFIMYHLWPTVQVGPFFFVALAAAAVVAVHLVQNPAQNLWAKYPKHAWWVTPVAVSIMLLLLSRLHEPEAIRGLPAFLQLEEDVVDVRLPLVAEGSEGVAVINPSILFRNGGTEVVIAARKHTRTSERVPGFYNGKDVTVIEETWHSEIVLGAASIDDGAWTAWLAGGMPVQLSALAPWDGLRTVAGSPWAHLCVREKFVPENNTLIRLKVTGPEDAKVFQLFPDVADAPGIDVAFNSYPPLGRYGCGKDGAVSQMFVARGVDPESSMNQSYGIHMNCGHEDQAEKNWIPFQRDGRLHFVYSVLPHVVMEVYADGGCGERYYSNFPPLVRLQQMQPGWAVRGSAQAVLVDDPLATSTLPRAHYLGLLHIVDTKTHRYAHFAYRFSNKVPFEILQVSTQLPLLAARESNGGAGFAFASGLAMRGQQVLITYAAGDSDPRVLALPLQKLDSLFSESQGGGKLLSVLTTI